MLVNEEYLLLLSPIQRGIDQFLQFLDFFKGRNTRKKKKEAASRM